MKETPQRPQYSTTRLSVSGPVSRWEVLEALKFKGVEKEVEELRQRLHLPVLSNRKPLSSDAVQLSASQLSDYSVGSASVSTLSQSSLPQGGSLPVPINRRGHSLNDNISPPVVFPEKRQKGSSLGRKLRTPEEILITDNLLNAARNGDVDTVKYYIFQNGVNPNSRNDEGQTPIYCATLEKQPEIIKLLLVHPDLDPNVKDIVGQTPLHVACKLGRQRRPDPEEKAAPPPSAKEQEEDDRIVQIVRILVSDDRTDINAKDFSFNTPLAFACAIGNYRVAEILINSGANVNTTTVTQVTPLHTACQMGFTDIASLLISNGATVNCKDYAGYTPLHLAAQANHIDVCKLLKSNGADVKAQLKENKKTPVHLTTSEYLKDYLLDLKTSFSHPFQIDFIAPVDPNSPIAITSKLGMCMCPGRSKREHRRNLDMDIEVLKKTGVNVLVSLVRQSELDSMGIPDMLQRISDAGIESIHQPILDKWLPASMDELITLCNKILTRLRDGKIVVVHCNGGKGRTGLVVVSCLVMLGLDPSEATDVVRASRPGMLYNPAQILYVRALKAYLTGQLW